MSSPTLVRYSGFAMIAGSVLILISSTGVLGAVVSLATSTGSEILILVLMFDSSGWLMLAACLLILGIYLMRQLNEEGQISRLFKILGVGAAAVSVVVSLAGLFVLTLEPVALAVRTLPGPLQANFGPTITALMLGGITIASVSLGVALLRTWHLGWWWVILPVLGLLMAPQVLGLALGVVSTPVAGSFLDPRVALAFGTYALLTVGWIAFGLLLVFRAGEHRAGSSRVT